MIDPRARYFARLRRLRRSARRWTVIAATLVGAALVLLPYQGLRLSDAFWAAAAGGSSALAWWRWSDTRELAAQPAPPELDPAARAARNQQRLESFVGKLPIGRTALAEMHRMQHLSKVRGSAVAPAAARLDRAVKTLAGLVSRLTGPGHDALTEADAAERSLRDLAERIASIERAMNLVSGAEATHGSAATWAAATGAGVSAPVGGPVGTGELAAAHAALMAQFDTGVVAYEGLVAAAATYVAEEGRLGEPLATGRLVDAADLLRGIASGMSDLRTTDPYRPA